MLRYRRTKSIIKQQVRISKKMVVFLDERRKIIYLDINGNSLKLPNIQLKVPLVAKTEIGIVTIEDLEIHPMNLANRWGILKDLPDYKSSDHQERFIITFEGINIKESYIIPKVFYKGEPIIRVAVNEQYSLTPFSIEIMEVKQEKVQVVIPQKPKSHYKILLCTQILGHVQETAMLMEWAQGNGTLQNKWKIALPATKRTEITKDALRKKNIPIDDVTCNWSYSGGKDFRTGLEYREDFSKQDSFSTVSGFMASNARLCMEVAKGKYAVVATNFHGEAQLMKTINSNILISGISHTFLSGRLRKRISQHHDLPRLTLMLQRVQNSLDLVPKRIIALEGNVNFIDYYWKICKEKVHVLDALFYRSFDFDTKIPLKLNNTTQVIQVPFITPNITISKKKAREKIGKVINKKIKPTDKIIILNGESDDGSFKRKAQAVIEFAREHPDVHIIMPLELMDQRISELDIPANTHAIGFRQDWLDVIAGGDITIIRGSWGEIRDLVVSHAIPIIISPSAVPMNCDLDTTQFLTQVSEERACNISLFIKALQSRGIKSEMINKLIVDLDNPLVKRTLKEAIEYALQLDVGNELHSAISSIPRGDTEWVGVLHEQLLDQRRPFSARELTKIQNSIWGPNRGTT